MKHLLHTGDVAELLGVTRPRVSQLVAERDDFPEPYAYTYIGKRNYFLWTAEAIERWNATADRSPGNPGLRNRRVN